MKYKVTIVEDHKMVSEGLEVFINHTESFEVQSKFFDGISFINSLALQISDVIVLDLNLPKVSGMEILEYFRPFSKKPTILVVTTYNDLEFMNKCQSLGAAGYLLKNTDNNELLKALKHIVSEGSFYQGPGLDKKLSQKEGDDPFYKIVSLTQREKEMIPLIVQEKKEEEISDLLCLSTHTVKSYRKTLYKKLNVNSGIGLTKFAIQNGLYD